jgi:drug/metabolite transporter (DMT)-like permease
MGLRHPRGRATDAQTSRSSPVPGRLAASETLPRMPVLLGLAAAVTYGAGDFVGGLASRRLSPLVVVIASQVAGLVLLAGCVAAAPAGFGAQAFAWGLPAGLAGGIGVLLLYRGLARGRMSVVAPVTAVEAAAVPVLFGLLSGEEPGTLRVAGIGLALAAIALVSRAESSEEVDPKAGLVEALGAGLGFGIFFITLEQAGSDTGLWPLIATKASSIGVVAALALSARPSFRVTGDDAVQLVVVGVLDAAANVFYLSAVRQELLSLVAVLTSLYPAATVVLARVVLHERFTRVQSGGLVCAAGAVALLIM